MGPGPIAFGIGLSRLTGRGTLLIKSEHLDPPPGPPPGPPRAPWGAYYRFWMTFSEHHSLGFSSTGSHSSRIAQGSHIAAGRHYQRQQQPAVLSLGPSQGPQTKLPDTAPSHDSPHSSVCSHQVIDQYVFFHRQSLHRVRRPFQVVHGQSPLMVRHHRGCLWPPACPTLTGRRWRRRRGEPCSLRWARPSRSSGTRPGRC
jgi:hypothetical protein